MESGGEQYPRQEKNVASASTAINDHSAGVESIRTVSSNVIFTDASGPESPAVTLADLTSPDVEVSSESSFEIPHEPAMAEMPGLPSSP